MYYTSLIGTNYPILTTHGYDVYKVLSLIRFSKVKVTGSCTSMRSGDMLHLTLYVKFCSWFYFQLRQEKVELEHTLEKEQEYQVNKLMRKIEKLERETLSKQATLEQVRAILFLYAGPWSFSICVSTSNYH